MKQKSVGNILVTALLLCLFMTGNAFATNYAYVLLPDNDVIRVYNYDGNTLSATLDLDGGSYIYDEDLNDDGVADDPGIEITTYITMNKDYSPNAFQTFGKITAMAVGPQERYLYFATDYDDSNGALYQLDITGDPGEDIAAFTKITKLAEVGDKPKDIAIDSFGNNVFVANFGDDSVTKYAKTSGTPLTIYGFYKPVALAVTAGTVTSGSDLYVANFASHSDNYYVSMYNTFTKIDIAVENRPTDIVTTMDDEYVYVCNSSISGDETQGLISVIKPIDYLDYESDGDIITDAGENTVVDKIYIAGAKPTRMALVELENRIYAIDPVFGESDEDLTISSGAGIMSVIDCSGRVNETIDPDDDNDANTFSQNVTPTVTTGAYSGGISIAGTRNGTSVFTVTGVENSFFQTDIESATHQTDVFATDAGVSETYSQIILSGTMPNAVSGLTAEAESGQILLHWYDNADDELGYFILRRDHDDDAKEYKYYLFDTVEGNTGLGIDDDDPHKREYTDDTVRKGHTYEYLVVPYNGITRANTGNPIKIKARDDDSSEICFISSVERNTGSPLIAFMLIAGFIIVAAIRKQKA